jgi:hypothetical protein
MGKGDEKVLLNYLRKSTVRISQYYLQQMASHKKSAKNDLDRIMAKWLPPLWMKVWQNGKCPIKAKGFSAWRKLVVYDTDMPKMAIGHQNKD